MAPQPHHNGGFGISRISVPQLLTCDGGYEKNEKVKTAAANNMTVVDDSVPREVLFAVDTNRRSRGISQNMGIYLWTLALVIMAGAIIYLARKP